MLKNQFNKIDIPHNQVEANALYAELDHKMADENIFEDGEVDYTQASKTFNKHLKIAKEINQLTGFEPTIVTEKVFFEGKFAKPMEHSFLKYSPEILGKIMKGERR